MQTDHSRPFGGQLSYPTKPIFEVGPVHDKSNKYEIWKKSGDK